MSDLTQQALTALADAGLGNESAAEAFVVRLPGRLGQGAQPGHQHRKRTQLGRAHGRGDRDLRSRVLRGHTRPHQLGRRQRSLQTGMAARGQKGARSCQRHENEGTTMNENTTLTDIIDAALAAGCQISVTITPKDFYNESQEPEE